MNKLLFTIATLFAYSGMFSQTWNTGTGAWISPLSKNIGIQKSLQIGDNVGTDSLWCKTDLNYFEGNVGIGTTTPEAKLHVSISDTLGNPIAHFENNIDNAIITVHTHSDSSAFYGLQTEDFNSALGLSGTTGKVILLTGLGVEAITIDTTGSVTIPDLAGSGKRLVTASATGVLDTSSTEEVLYFTKVTLSSSELLAGADVTVIPAVPNKIIRLDPFLSFSKYVHNTTAYVGATGLSLRLDGGTTGVATTAANWQTSTTKRTQLLGTTPIATTINFLVGQPLEVTFPGGALTTGDGTVVLYLYYTLVND